MKILVVLLNVFLCPIGTFVAGKIVSGIIQVILLVIAAVFVLTGIGLLVAIPIGLVVWIWGIIIAIQYKSDDGIQRFG